MNDATTDIEVTLAMDAVEHAKRRLSPADKRRAEMHDDEVFERTLAVLQRKRGQMKRPRDYSIRVATKDMNRRINRERKRVHAWDGGLNEIAKKVTAQCFTDSDPIVEAFRRESSERLMTALHRLPKEQEEVLRRLYLSAGQDQNLSVVALQLGVVRQTVATRRDQGLAALKILFSTDSESMPDV